MDSSPAIELRGVAKIYDRTAALRAVSLQVPCAGTLLLLGPNGSGKTTLLKILAGVLAPTLGGGTIFGRDMVADRIALRQEVGLLASETYLYDDLSGRENLAYSMTMAGHRPRLQELQHILDRVGLDRAEEMRVRTYSSGMKRRLALARLLLLRPRLLLLDEPYNSMDAEAADLVDAALHEVVSGGGAAVVATHDAARGMALADQVAVLDRGSLLYLGVPGGYRRRDAHYVG